MTFAPKLPKALLGGFVGYYTARYSCFSPTFRKPRFPPLSHYYVHSGDCADRFYRSAAQGEVVRRLRLKPMCPDCRGGMDLSDPRYPGELERLVKGEKEKEAKKNKVNALQQLDFRDYVLPSEELEERGSIIREGLSQPISYNWDCHSP